MRMYIDDAEKVVSNKKLTPYEIELVYRLKENDYRLDDAQRHVEDLWPEGGVGYDICMDGLQDIVDRFQENQDCNEPENDTWDNVIREYLEEYLRG